MMKKHILKRNLISFFLSYCDGVDGEITFGYINPDKFVGKIQYYPVIDKYYWTIKLDDIKLGDKSLKLCPKGCKAIIDSGTSQIAGPSEDLENLISLIRIGVNCENYNEGKSIVFVFNGMDYEIKVKDYIIKRETFYGEICRPMLMPLDVPDPQ